MVLTHLWWNVFSRFSCRLSGIQHSAPYRRIERTHTMYTLFLVDSFRSLSRKTAFLSAPKAFDACATLLLTSASIFLELSTKDPRYGNSSTASTIPPSSTIGARSSSSTSLPVTMCLVLGMLTVKPKSRVVCWYTPVLPSLLQVSWMQG